MAQADACEQKIRPAGRRADDFSFETFYITGEVYHRGLPVPKRIKIQFLGAQDAKGNVRLADFIDQLSLIKRALYERERLIAHVEHSQIEYKVVDLHHSEATVILEPVALDGAKGYVDQVVVGFSDELRSIRRDATIIDQPELDRLETYCRIGERRDNLIAKVRIEVARKSVTIDRTFKANVKKILGPDEFTQGSISGMLETINFHNTNRFTLYPKVGPERVAGTFNESLRSSVKAAIGNFVTVVGKLKYKQWASFPHGIIAEDFDVHEPDSELPRLSELRGAFAGITGDLSSIEFVEKIRNEGW